MNPGLLPLVTVAVVVLALTLAWPEFWDTKDLPFDEDDSTRGDWERIPHQGHPPDVW